MGVGDFFEGGGFFGDGDFFGGGPLPHFFCTNHFISVKLSYPPNFNFLGKPLLGKKRKRKKEK